MFAMEQKTLLLAHPEWRSWPAAGAACGLRTTGARRSAKATTAEATTTQHGHSPEAAKAKAKAA